MNDLLKIKATFEQAKFNNYNFSMPILKTNSTVMSSDLINRKEDLERLLEYWSKQDILEGALISVYYIKLAAKSNRIKCLLSKGSKITSNSSIVGVRYSKTDNLKHIITHYVSLDTIKHSIKLLEDSIKILNDKFNGIITDEIMVNIKEKKISFKPTTISKTNFCQIIVDCYYVESFNIHNESNKIPNNSIITLYKTDKDTRSILQKIGIHLLPERIINNDTILLNQNQFELLYNKAQYLISMAVSDISLISKDDFNFSKNKNEIKICSPKNEPTIGVIDTLFDEKVYFSEWVEYHKYISDDIPLSSEDYNHGTAVSSIIVDGPSLNPKLDDNCGRFKVRHFGVSTSKSFSSFTILRNIKEIIASNKDIKVWNLSLGSELEINQNFISPEAAILDQIQFENDVIFVISGTNKRNSENDMEQKIGSPADSINSIVVNSIDFNNEPAKYSRKGPVLSFFVKPDVSYYGGDENEALTVYTNNGETFVKGTSFAAPWISRKLSYLIDILGLSREIAKALIIHSACGWEKEKINPDYIGNGIVPIKISDIIQSQNDEIQFIISGISEKYDSYFYDLPIPVIKEKHPFVAKLTACYFPACSRNQGVDYTNTELDVSFGRLNDKKGIVPINNNYQSKEFHYTTEKEARNLYRKWDNVKLLKEVFTSRNRPKQSYSSGLWGISLKTKERLEKKYGENLRFGLIVTLKEINGVNRFDEFKKNCKLRGLIISTIKIENRIDIYNIAEETIELED